VSYSQTKAGGGWRNRDYGVGNRESITGITMAETNTKADRAKKARYGGLFKSDLPCAAMPEELEQVKCR
jgi:hypothetical protein